MSELYVMKWLLIGFVPFWISRRRGWLEVKALFWSLQVRRCPLCGERSWELRIVLLERLKGVVWAVVEQLKR